MDIVVCIKQVPNTKELRIDPKTNNIVRTGVPSILNPYDATAIESALNIRDKVGGTVTAISMGPKQAHKVLKEALNMGADRAVLLCDKAFAGSDTLATGYALSVLIKKICPDLVICGSEAIDGCTAQVGPIIAEFLGWAQITRVSSIEIINNTLIIERDVRDGYEILSTKVPAVVCVLKDINQPRNMVKTDKEPEEYTADYLDYEMNRLGIKGSPTKVTSISFSGKFETGFVFIDGTLPAEDRVRLMINGGVVPKKIKLNRGSTEEIIKLIMDDPVVKRHANTMKEKQG